MRDDRSGIGTGVILILVGILFMADRQGYASFSQLWPLILIGLGVTTMAFPKDETIQVGVVAGRRGARRRYRSRTSGGLWMILVGVLLLANQNHWMSFRDSWPLFIVAGGLSLIVGGLGRRSSDPVIDANGSSAGSTPGDAQGGGQWR